VTGLFFLYTLNNKISFSNWRPLRRLFNFVLAEK
jgi:hypothetical protein